MAIFSNFEGTMQNSFILGKSGAKISTDGNSIQVQNYNGTVLIPISAADPVQNSHLVTLSYFNSHSTGGSGYIRRGTVPPTGSIGEDGDVYFEVDDNNTIAIYIKDLGIWKPFVGGAVLDSNYVTSYTVIPSDFTFNSGTNEYAYVLSESVHGRGADILVQTQDPSGNTLDSTVQISGTGDVTVGFTDLPSTNIVIKLIGATTMTTPYSAFINQSQWTLNAGVYSLVVSAATHQQEAGPLYLAVYANDVPGATAQAPFNLTMVSNVIDGSGNVTFTSLEAFSGKVVISGK